jgi:hypothetical protein
MKSTEAIHPAATEKKWNPSPNAETSQKNASFRQL